MSHDDARRNRRQAIAKASRAFAHAGQGEITQLIVNLRHIGWRKSDLIDCVIYRTNPGQARANALKIIKFVA